MQKANAGAPVREPMVDSETQKKMMEFAQKRREESKKLDQDENDDYLNSDWANSG